MSERVPLYSGELPTNPKVGDMFLKEETWTYGASVPAEERFDAEGELWVCVQAKASPPPPYDNRWERWGITRRRGNKIWYKKVWQKPATLETDSGRLVPIVPPSSPRTVKARVQVGGLGAGNSGPLTDYGTKEFIEVPYGPIDKISVTNTKVLYTAEPNKSDITIATSSTRSEVVPSPFTGQFVFLTDTSTLQRWDGSAWVAAITTVPTAAPTSVTASNATSTTVDLSFSAGADGGSTITNYQYALSTDGGSTYGAYAALSPADGTSPITLTGLDSGVTYYVKLKAVNALGAGSSESTPTSLATTFPAPTSLAGTALSTTSISISFTQPTVSGLTNYQYALSTDGGSTYGSYAALSPADSTSPITISGLSAGTTYHVKLRGVGTGGVTGTQSSAVSVTTTAEVPSTVDYLVIAGGGGGSGGSTSPGGGGGGAGGLRCTVTATGGGGSLPSALSVAASTNYTVTVGGGGAGRFRDGGTGTSGSASTFASISTVGGGGGGAYENIAGLAGGSGGGGSWSFSSGGAGTASQGYNGGTGAGNNTQAGGGGGGAGGAGAAGVDSPVPQMGASGGAGITTAISGTSTTYAGGGAGGTGYNQDSAYSGNTNHNGTAGGGGAGGAGGTGNQGTNGGNGTANKGGGGGGAGARSSSGTTGGSGGSGVVIIRYPSNLAQLASIGAGLTYTTTTSGGYRIYTFTAGSGNISW